MNFGPSLLNQKNPKLAFIGTAENRVGFLIDRDEIIDDNLLYFPFYFYLEFVDAVLIVLLICKNILYMLFPLG